MISTRVPPGSLVAMSTTKHMSNDSHASRDYTDFSLVKFLIHGDIDAPARGTDDLLILQSSRDRASHEQSVAPSEPQMCVLHSL